MKIVFLLFFALIFFNFVKTSHSTDLQNFNLQAQSGFIRLTYGDVKTPSNMQSIGLLGANYYAYFTPKFYGGMGLYSAMTGTQGGLFVLIVGGGLQQRVLGKLFADAGLDIGGGGGGSSLVGGGLMLRPHTGLLYDIGFARLGINYAYVTFPTGRIHSSQVSASIDFPFDFYYLNSRSVIHGLSKKYLQLPIGKYLFFQRNDAGIILQAYRQHSGSLNTLGEEQSGTIKLVGVELDHYFTSSFFGWLKASGAFAGIPNGYMDALAGLGLHWPIPASKFFFVPQLGIGAGGGGQVDTGGGFLMASQLGLEIPLSQHLALRTSGGYLWSPKGQLNAYTFTGMFLYHFDIGSGSALPTAAHLFNFTIQNWRIHIFNQTYLHPQRTFSQTTSPINLLVLQIDQILNKHFFIAYQGAFAYSGDHAGGYASGMVGPGFQTPELMKNRLRVFGEILLGAGGGGSLQLNGGAIIEPMIGINYKLTPALHFQASVGELKALQSSLNTPVINIGFNFNFGVVEKR